MALPLVVAGLVLELVDDDLRALRVGHDLTGHRHLLQGFQLCGDRRAIDEQDSGKRDGSAGLAVELLDLDDVTLGDLVLLAAGLDDRVHRGRAFLPVGYRLPGAGLCWSLRRACRARRCCRRLIAEPGGAHPQGPHAGVTGRAWAAHRRTSLTHSAVHSALRRTNKPGHRRALRSSVPNEN